MYIGRLSGWGKIDVGTRLVGQQVEILKWDTHSNSMIVSGIKGNGMSTWNDSQVGQRNEQEEITKRKLEVEK